MRAITDEFMKKRISATKNYAIVILKSGPKMDMPGAEKIIWEHGRRNFELREEGLMPIVCPVSDGGDIHGVCILDADVDRAKKIMDGDPGVEKGIFVYEVHPCRSFPGDCLP